MSTLLVPRYEIPIVDVRTGNMDRNWYKYFAQIGNSIGSSTYSDDAQILDVADDAASEALSLKALRIAQNAEALFFYGVDDPKKPDDLSLLAWWPQ